MTHVVTALCERCRFTECVTVCPVACFHGDAERLYIDPAICVDCGACVPVCPVRAIFDVFDLAPDDAAWAEVNRERAQALPVVRDKAVPLPTAQARRTELGR